MMHDRTVSALAPLGGDDPHPRQPRLPPAREARGRRPAVHRQRLGRGLPARGGDALVSALALALVSAPGWVAALAAGARVRAGRERAARVAHEVRGPLT